MIQFDPFKDFEFQQLKSSFSEFDNPISQIFANHLIFNTKSQGCFLPIPLPTGIGKTHNMLVVILEWLLYLIKTQLNASPNDSKTNPYKRIIFITNSVDNVAEAYQKLLLMIDNDCRFNDSQKQYLKQFIVYAPSTAISLYETINHQKINPILDIFNINDTILIKQLREISFDIETLEHTDKSSVIYYNYRTKVEKTLTTLFSQIFKSIVSHQLKAETLPLTLEQIETIAYLLPAVKLEYNQAYVAFMTTKKFLHGVHQTKGKHKFTENMEDSALIIDEVDRQNNEILSHLVESNTLDMLTTAKKIQANLEFTTISKRPQYTGIAEKMSEFHQVLTKFVIENHLDKTFDMDNVLEEKQPRPLLFSDRLSINATNIRSPLYVVYDNIINQNIIFGKDSPYITKDNYRFTPMVNRLNKLIAKDFAYHILTSVNLFQRNVDKLAPKKSDRPVQSEINFVMNTILQQFNLLELRNDVLEQIYTMTGKNNTYISHDGTYHTQGISLTNIHRPSETGDSVIFFHQGFNHSPTGMLAKWVEQGCHVIGISATATNHSVVHNFDMEYLKYRLANQMMSLQPAEIQQVRSYYNQQRNYDSCHIKLNFSKLSANFDFLLTISCQLERPNDWQHIDLTKSDVRNMLTQQLVKRLNLTLNDNEDEGHFAFKWISKACQAIAQFYTTHQYSNRYMVLMLNRHLWQELADFFNGYIEYLDRMYNVKTTFIRKVNAQFLKSKKFHQVVKSTLNKTKNKVIVFTTYQTFSSGANPDYPFQDWELPYLVQIAEYSEQGQRTDIDCLYLEKPTHIISGDNNEPIASQLMLLAQGMALQEAGQLSNNQAYHWANKVIETLPEQASIYLKRHLYNKNHQDYINACCRDIEQAIGRTNRTGYKRHQVFFWYDDDLIPILSQDKRKDAIFSHEYQKLLDAVKQETSNSQMDLLTDEIQNQAQTAHRRTMRMIDERLYELNEPLDSDIPRAVQQRQGIVAKWTAMRVIAGRAPNAENMPTYPNARYYLALPEPDICYAYAIKNPKDKHLQDFQISDYGEEYVFFDKATAESNYHKVSESECRLPIIVKNPVIRAYFEQHDIATTWSNKANYVLTPAMYTNIYKGYLGESAGTAILQHHGFNVIDLPVAYYEKFDNLLEINGVIAWVDFKNWKQIVWQSSHKTLRDETMQKIRDKFLKLQADYRASHQVTVDKLIICNLMADIQEREDGWVDYYDATFNLCSPQQATIMTITGIIDEQTGETNLTAVTALKKWLTQ